MPIKVRHIWVEASGGASIPDTDLRLYDVKCDACGTYSRVGSARYGGEFLCLGCLDEKIRPEEDSD